MIENFSWVTFLLVFSFPLIVIGMVMVFCKFVDFLNEKYGNEAGNIFIGLVILVAWAFIAYILVVSR